MQAITYTCNQGLLLIFRTSVTLVPLRSAVRGKGALHLQYILLSKMHSNLHLLYSALCSAICSAF